MTAPVQRKLPGTPIPRQKLIAEWEDLRHHNLLKAQWPAFCLIFTSRSPRRPTNGASNSTAVACATFSPISVAMARPPKKSSGLVSWPTPTTSAS